MTIHTHWVLIINLNFFLKKLLLLLQFQFEKSSSTFYVQFLLFTIQLCLNWITLRASSYSGLNLTPTILYIFACSLYHSPNFFNCLLFDYPRATLNTIILNLLYWSHRFRLFYPHNLLAFCTLTTTSLIHRTGSFVCYCKFSALFNILVFLIDN